MNDRLMIAAGVLPAVVRVLFGGVTIKNTSLNGEELAAVQALAYADALLAAAGEKDDPATHEDCVSVAVHNAVMDRLQVDFDALKARAEAAESKLAASESQWDAAESEIAALKRRLEPLTREEGGGVNNPTIYGSRPLAWDEITAIVADADRIRARRA